MAATLAGARLTEGHRLAQARLRADTVARLLAVWPLLDPKALDATAERWLTAALPIVEAQRAASAVLAESYARAFRATELDAPPADLPTVGLRSFATDQAATSLLVTGPVRVKAAMRTGAELVDALDLGRAGSAAAGSRVALDGGRDLLADTVAADPEVTVYERVTSGRPCAFCAMLASRGPVYSPTTVTFRSHDHCGCNLEPAYVLRRSERSFGLDRNREYARLWNEVTPGAGDATARFNAFRRELEARRSPASTV